MRKSLSIAAALLIAATGTAFAHGGANSDRGDTNPFVPGATQQVQVATSSQTAELPAAGAHVESLR
jgi:hypothetical protein